MDPMLASIMIFAGNFAPRGWAYCDGQLLAINSHTALFSLLGTTYGGDGRTTFALPDLRGRVAIGPRHGPGLSNYVLGQRGGVETVTLTQLQIPSHTHLASVVEGAAHIPVNTTDGDADSTSPAAGVLANTGDDLYTTSAPNGYYGATAPVIGTSITNLPTGGSQWHTNIQPYLAINYIIAMEGYYPSRS
ncbi:phage tail protein [Pseudotenacibaculum haliotis]|uniref:Phage tail protein n=1 Tax=Pseudotenacibaculum haliotis TaxID=1862138 RepID=A0ABW5LRG5_9FLAO